MEVLERVYLKTIRQIISEELIKQSLPSLVKGERYVVCDDGQKVFFKETDCLPHVALIVHVFNSILKRDDPVKYLPNLIHETYTPIT